MIQKDTKPRCADCNARTDRVIVERGPGGTQHEFFLCASCEYLRANPDAPRAVKLPRERSKRLQKETLFEVA